MENKYYPKVEASDFKEIIGALDVSNDMLIQIDDWDICNTLVDGDNAILVEGRSSGEDKVAKSIDEIDTQAKSLAVGNLYTAKRVLLYIESAPEEDILTYEMQAVTDFISRFGDEINVIWGVAKRSIEGADTIVVKLLASGIE